MGSTVLQSRGEARMSLFASALMLDRKTVGDKRITDSYSVHRVVFDLFEDVRTPDEKAQGASSGLLFVDQGGDINGRNIMILSNRAPKHQIVAPGQIVTKLISPEFLEYDKYSFKIVINATTCCPKTKAIVPVKSRDCVAVWFTQRAPKWGFTVMGGDLCVDTIDVDQFSGKNNNAITLSKAHLRGQLQVTDREAFIRSFTNGLGRGKAFGCGLLQIVPLIENHF